MEGTFMNKILVMVFDEESAAYEGLSLLRNIHNDGDISLYATAVITKDSSGEVSVKETLDEGPVGTAFGMLLGSMVGLLGGPAGMALGASLGSLSGMLSDLDNAGINIAFVDEVSSALTPGKAAVIADVEETWVMPVDMRVGELGGRVYRRLRSEVIYDQLLQEYTALETELDQLETELKQATTENKTAIQKHIDTVKKKITAFQGQSKEKVEKFRVNTEAKIASLKEQMKQATDNKKAAIEKRIAQIKSDFNTRSSKLKQAKVLAQDALFS